MPKYQRYSTVPPLESYSNLVTPSRLKKQRKNQGPSYLDERTNGRRKERRETRLATRRRRATLSLRLRSALRVRIGGRRSLLTLLLLMSLTLTTASVISRARCRWRRCGNRCHRRRCRSLPKKTNPAIKILKTRRGCRKRRVGEEGGRLPIAPRQILLIQSLILPKSAVVAAPASTAASIATARSTASLPSSVGRIGRRHRWGDG